jgi:hypothetical protein
VKKVELKAEKIKVNQDQKDKDDPEKADLPWTPQECMERMIQINTYIREVSFSLYERSISVFGVFSSTLLCLINNYNILGSRHLPQEGIHLLAHFRSFLQRSSLRSS